MMDKNSRTAVSYLGLMLLRQGPMPARLIIAIGLKEGFTLDQLKIAKKTAGIQSIRNLTKKNQWAEWWWVLPQTQEETSAEVEK